MGFIKVSFEDIKNNNHTFSASLYQKDNVNYSFYQNFLIL